MRPAAESLVQRSLHSHFRSSNPNQRVASLHDLALLAMALNATTVIHRAEGDEQDDLIQVEKNFHDERWKEWPNEAGFVGLEEHRGPLQLEVKGSFPAWTAGSLYRTGPGLSAVETANRGTHNVSHWFDGFAHAHKFDIAASATDDDGATTVTYSSRRQASDLVDSIKKRGWHAGVSFGQKSDPCVGLFAKATSVFKPTPMNYNVAIYRNLSALASKGSAGSSQKPGGRTAFVATDTPGLLEIDPDTLEPLGVIDQSRLHPALKGSLSCAHAQRDSKTGDLFNFNLQFGPSPTYRVFRVNASNGTTDILATVSGTDVSPAYIHSFFLTENYVVLCIPSSHFRWSGARILYERNILEALKPFDESNECKWLVVDRHHNKGVVARFSTPAGFFFHSINAFEECVYDENNKKRVDICMDYVKFNTTEIMLGLYYDVILDRNDEAKRFWGLGDQDLNPQFTRHRFRLPLGPQKPEEAATATAEEAVSIPGPHAGDLPTINPAYACKPYRYVFSTSNRGLSTIADALVKTDILTRHAILWCGPVGHAPGEPVFVPRPQATDEDDGVVLSVVLDGSAQESYLICLDARTMMEMGRAEARFPIAVGLHGQHAPA
ncbi:class II aldolase [Purpureocillium lavendulum]|uniref:Class II aldolase n=1 Tax=Purpureocillium lavendulum TaxID=1247861 RepID=A0AB34FD26_9HYPO|nr:class II aldolase [Purpureocillium lavendulum]